MVKTLSVKGLLITLIVASLLAFTGGSASAAWTSMDGGTEANLSAVWGSSEADVWVVGVLGTIVHYDGLAWSPVDPISP